MTVGSLPSSKKWGREGGDIEAANTGTYKPHQSDLLPHARVTT